MSVPDSTVEAAMRAAYDAYPQCWGPTGRPKTYEECYGMSPLANTDDANEMRIALQAALDEGGVVLASALAIKQGECDALWDELATHKARKESSMSQRGHRWRYVGLDGYRCTVCRLGRDFAPEKCPGPPPLFPRLRRWFAHR